MRGLGLWAGLGLGGGWSRDFERKPNRAQFLFILFGLRGELAVICLLSLMADAVILQLLELVHGAEEVPADLGVVAEEEFPEIFFDHRDDEGFVFGFGGAALKRARAIAFALVLPLVNGHVAEILLHLAASESAPSGRGYAVD